MRPRFPLVVAGLLAAGFVAASPTAAANHACFDPAPLDGDEAVQGVVYDPAVGQSSDFYIHSASSGHVGYSLVSGVGFHAQANPADADLLVWDSTCSWIVCSFTVNAGAVDHCDTITFFWWTSPHVIEVRYVFSHEAHVDYTLVSIR